MTLRRRPLGGGVRYLQPHQFLVLGFFAVILIGAFLLVLPIAVAPGQRVTVVDALFTATSAVTVTGLIVKDTATTWSPFGQGVILLLIQVGGFGIMTMTTLIALLRGKRISLPERLAVQQALGYIELAGVVRLVRYIFVTTVVIELVGALVLALNWADQYGSPRALYLGLFHSVSAFNNAGFDLFSISMIDQGPAVTLLIAGLFIFGGLGFVVWVDVAGFINARRRGRSHTLSVQTKMVLFVSGILLLLGTFLVLVWEFDNPATLGPMSIGDRVAAAFFQAATPRTAGFNSMPVAGLREVTLFFFILLMFVGASPGGTGGGVKTTTFAVMMLSVWTTIRGKTDVEVFGRRLGRASVDRALAIVTSGVVWVTLVVLILERIEGAPFLMVLFEAMSAFGTVGLSMGLTPELSDAGKLLIALTMFIGRVGPVTLAVALSQAQARRDPFIRLPEERMMVG